MKALKRNYGAIVGYTKGYFPDIKEDNELKDEIEDGVGEVAGEIIDAGTEPKAFREVENALWGLSTKYGTLGPEGPGQFIMVDQKYAKASTFFTKNADSIAGKFKTIGKIGTGLTVANFITSTYKD